MERQLPINVQLVGAGIFLARINRGPGTLLEMVYDISLNTLACSGVGGVQFSAEDLASLAKLVQLLIAEITLDGNVAAEERYWLRSLRDHIDRAMSDFEIEMHKHYEQMPRAEDQNATLSS